MQPAELGLPTPHRPSLCLGDVLGRGASGGTSRPEGDSVWPEQRVPRGPEWVSEEGVECGLYPKSNGEVPEELVERSLWQQPRWM